MIIKTVKYSQLFSFGMFQNETIGLEAELVQGETVKQVMRYLRVQVINIHAYNQKIRDTQIEIKRLQSQIDVDSYYLNDYVREELDAKGQFNYDNVTKRKMKNEEQLSVILEALNQLQED